MRDAPSVIDGDDPIAQAATAAIQEGHVDRLTALPADHPGLAAAQILDPTCATEPKTMRSLLHLATDWPGNCPNVAQTIQTLVAAGADPNARCGGPHTETPLHWAASSDDVDATAGAL